MYEQEYVVVRSLIDGLLIGPELVLEDKGVNQTIGKDVQLRIRTDAN